jgi:cytoskeletal protein RodZ
MRTIGIVLRSARKKRKLSVSELADVTKIKKDFIIAIENEKWHNLPEYPVVTGFVKSLAGSLDIEESRAMAILRRDYPPKKLEINPKPDVREKFSWSPRMTFFVGIIAAVSIVGIYLIVQYFNFVKPPTLKVEQPIENAVINESKLTVSGTTNPEATVKINNQPVIVEDDGKFSVEIEIVDNLKEIVVVAQTRSGKTTEVVRKINPEF